MNVRPGQTTRYHVGQAPAEQRGTHVFADPNRRGGDEHAQRPRANAFDDLPESDSSQARSSLRENMQCASSTTCSTRQSASAPDRVNAVSSLVRTTRSAPTRAATSTRCSADWLPHTPR